jgi:hypothetical protein
MPIKRRKAKARQLEDGKLYELQYGPGAFLMNGCGYLAKYNDRSLSDLSDAESRECLNTMRDDWKRHHRKVIEAWNARDEQEREIARRHYGNPERPWALANFGDEHE